MEPPNLFRRLTSPVASHNDHGQTDVERHLYSEDFFVKIVYIQQLFVCLRKDAKVMVFECE